MSEDTSSGHGKDVTLFQIQFMFQIQFIIKTWKDSGEPSSLRRKWNWKKKKKKILKPLVILVSAFSHTHCEEKSGDWD